MGWSCLRVQNWLLTQCEHLLTVGSSLFQQTELQLPHSYGCEQSVLAAAKGTILNSYLLNSTILTYFFNIYFQGIELWEVFTPKIDVLTVLSEKDWLTHHSY